MPSSTTCAISGPTRVSQGNCSGLFQVPVRLADGAYALTVTPGSGVAATRRFSVDTRAPVTLIDAPAAGTVFTGLASFSFHANEAGARMQCRVDTGALLACGSPRVTAAPRSPTAARASASIAENVGGLITTLEPSTSSKPVATGSGFEGDRAGPDAFGGVGWDDTSRTLYGGTANGVGGSTIDSVRAFSLNPADPDAGDPLGTVVADGFTPILSIDVRPNGQLLVGDDPTGGAAAGARLLLAGAGVLAAQIMSGPQGATSNPRRPVR